jgi:hypothetical protein
MNRPEIDKIIDYNKLHKARENSGVRPDSTPTSLFDIFPKANRHDIEVYTNDAKNHWLLVNEKSGQIVQYWRSV